MEKKRSGPNYKFITQEFDRTAQTTTKTLRVACLREKTEFFFEREAVVLIPSVDALFYLSSVGRKMEGRLLFASIRNAVTAGGWRQREATEER
jgi:hypothetical protein